MQQYLVDWATKESIFFFPSIFLIGENKCKFFFFFPTFVIGLHSLFFSYKEDDKWVLS